VLTAAGALKSAVQLLRKCKLPDCTAAYVEAATNAGFGSQSANSETGERKGKAFWFEGSYCRLV